MTFIELPLNQNQDLNKAANFKWRAIYKLHHTGGTTLHHIPDGLSKTSDVPVAQNRLFRTHGECFLVVDGLDN